MRLAAIDVGTVTTRLLVADVTADAVTEIARRTRITHLGEGLDASGLLLPDAVQRVTAAATGFVAEAQSLGAESVVTLATSAARDAENGDTLIAALTDAGAPPRVIEGAEEARLSYLGATFGMEGEGILVCDPGGGSTELSLGSAEGEGSRRRVDMTASRSVDVGARRMTERFLHSDPPRPAEIEAARTWAAEEFRPFFGGLDQKPRCLVTLAGTATTLAAMKQQLTEYDTEKVHGYVLSGADVSSMLEELASLPLARRREVTGLEPERAPVIVGGVIVVETVLALSGLSSTTVSEHDILYGIVLDAFAQAR